MTSKRQGHILWSSPLLMPVVAFIGGIVAGQHADLSTCWIVLGAAVPLCLVLFRWTSMHTPALLLTIAAIGAVRSAMERSQHEQVTWPDAFVSYEAVVVSETAEKPKTIGMDIIIAGDGRRLKCYIAKDHEARRLTIGDRLQLVSRIERNHEWRQGTFDYRLYQEVHGFAGQTFVKAGNWKLAAPSWEGLSAWQRLKLHFLSYRHQLLERYRAMGFSDSAYAVIAAMTLGDKTAMTRELREIYSVSGASHVLALSGLHLGIVYLLLSLLVVGRRWRFVTQLLAVAGVWAFALLVGLPASVVRAAITISMFALVSLANRGRTPVNTLALAAFVMLIENPYSLFDVGFQLSFAAMLAILLFQPLLEKLVSHKWMLSHPVVKWAWGLATVSVAAQLGTAPLVAYYFGRFSTWFLLTNFVVIPATTLILYLALVTLLIPAAGGVLLHVVSWLNTVLTLMATRLPFASIDGLRPSLLQTAAVYVIIVSMFIMITTYDKRI